MSIAWMITDKSLLHLALKLSLSLCVCECVCAAAEWVDVLNKLTKKVVKYSVSQMQNMQSKSSVLPKKTLPAVII